MECYSVIITIYMFLLLFTYSEASLISFNLLYIISAVNRRMEVSKFIQWQLCVARIFKSSNNV